MKKEIYDIFDSLLEQEKIPGQREADRTVETETREQLNNLKVGAGKEDMLADILYVLWIAA